MVSNIEIAIRPLKRKKNEHLTITQGKSNTSAILDEYTTKEIAGKLYVSSETIRTHGKNIMEKFQARNVAGLIRKTFESRLIYQISA